MRTWFLASMTLVAFSSHLAAASAAPTSFTNVGPTAARPIPTYDFIVKASDPYLIVAYGAQGGQAGGSSGGPGAKFGGVFTFTTDTALRIVVGGLGSGGVVDGGGGGGGGSFVTIGNTTVIAAGGGGGGAGNGSTNGGGGVISANGANGINSGTNGGINGGGGGAGTTFFSGAGGGGINGDGGNGSRSQPGIGPGAGGGSANSPNATTPYSGGSSIGTFGVGGDGGFGGGGSGDSSGGGGGGYGGGGGGSFSSISGYGGGGGGGSFLAPSSTGIFTAITSASLQTASFQSGNGLITIENLSGAPAPGTVIPEPASLFLLSSAISVLAMRRYWN